MHKKIILIIVLMIVIAAATQRIVSAIPNYNQEEILLCPTFEELERNPELKLLGCACGSDLFTREDFNTAITFLKK